MRAVLAFVVLTYVASWLLWIASAEILGGTFAWSPGLVVISGPLYLLGVFAPALVALVLTARTEGRAALASLLRQTLAWSVGGRWYLFAVVYFASVRVTVAIAHRVISGEWPAFDQTPWLVVLIAVAVSTPVQAGEEIGWRGYLLSRLSSRIGLPWASIIVGIIWGSWHLPFFLIAGTDKSGQSFPLYVSSVTALSVAMAWLYWRTRGNLLLMMLMHSAVNNANLVLTPASPPGNPFALRLSLVSELTVALLWLCAVFFLLAMRGQRALGRRLTGISGALP